MAKVRTGGLAVNVSQVLASAGSEQRHTSILEVGDEDTRFLPNRFKKTSQKRRSENRRNVLELEF